MVFHYYQEIRGRTMKTKKKSCHRMIRIGIALLCITALAMTVSAAPPRAVPGNVQPVTVNVSPVATQTIQMVPERIVVVTTTTVSEQTRVVTTTVPVFVDRDNANIAPVTTKPTPASLVVQARSVNTTVRNNGPDAGIVTVENKPVKTVNPTDLSKERTQETTTGTKIPWTGQDLSKDANPGYGLPGGKDISKELPSGEDRLKGRGNGVLGAGSDYLGQGTPFDKNPNSNSMDDFLNQHGGNIPDPLEAYGKSRSGISPADPGSSSSGEHAGNDQPATATTEAGSTIICGSDYIGVENMGKNKDECYVIEFDSSGGFKTEADRKNAVDLILKWMPKEKGTSSGDQQYEGEGGYVGGGGSSPNDILVGSTGRIKGTGIGRDPGDAGLGKDTGGKTPVLLEAIGKYVAQGGKVHGASGGYKPGDSGQGNDIAGTSENRVSGLKNAINAKRFIFDPDTMTGEEVPWWMEKVVSPNTMSTQQTAAQANAKK